MEELAHSGCLINVKFSPCGGCGPKNREGPASPALAKNLDTKGKEGVWGNRAWVGAGEEMPPVLAFASDLLLNKHISGLRVKYIGLQQSGRPFGDQLLIFVQTFNLLYNNDLDMWCQILLQDVK